jgi:hypothetical protein
MQTGSDIVMIGVRVRHDLSPPYLLQAACHANHARMAGQAMDVIYIGDAPYGGPRAPMGTDPNWREYERHGPNSVHRPAGAALNSLLFSLKGETKQRLMAPQAELQGIRKRRHQLEVMASKARQGNRYEDGCPDAACVGYALSGYGRFSMFSESDRLERR